ncbi:mannose-1-phosphate guanyltransferase [Escherichia coli]|nr:mannose-1-phosphate guanyltransferase [Escherichia coli]MBA1870163.1 mannose-1-phosphate guanyltransferase [Escherichia coli]
MAQSKLYPVVMAGGSGSRLWPLSRVLYPKQFLCLKGDLTMLQTTICRLNGVECESPVVICNEQHRFIVAEQLRQLNKLTENIILEPAGRNTAPAIALAALAAKRHSPESDPLMLVLAADHVIADEDAFRAAVRNAMPYAEAGKLVTFGIVPDLPETGYGYIRRGEVSAGEQDTVAFEVAQFVEKPNLETAQAYVASGEYYWNSGMFLFRAGRYLEELKKYRPDILDACEKAMSAVDPDLDFIRVDEEAFLACPEESVDYAVMERTADAVVVPMDAGWSDVGSWSSLWEISAHTAEGNVCHGDVINHKTENSYVYAESGLVTTVGVKDLVVVQTKDAVLIADRNAVQDVKKVVEQIKADGRHEHRVHREVYRPWGKYDSIDAGDRYQVKRIMETAQAYVASGEYYWNSGMFLFRAGRYLEELKKYRPDILDACEKAMSAVDPDLDFIRVDEEAFLACPEESVDYAVMERTADAVVVPMDAGWSDVGSWSSLWEISAHTAEGNVCHGDVINHKTENSYVYAESGLVTTVGVKDLVVVQTKDAVLIADRNAVQDVKKVVEQIKADGRHEHRVHREVYRPWGKYDSIDAGDRYQVKRITVKPGEGLSVQMHHHRAEHWVVVAGTAKVTIDGDIKLLGENESIYIPLGATHCLENPGKIPLDLIEVRSGSYLEEDDVVRFADRYGRV